MIDAYNLSDNPGRFEIRKSNQDVLFVVGTQSRDSQGHLLQQQPIFDVLITLAKQKRTAIDAVQLICRKIAEQGRVKVKLGVIPRNVLAHSQVTVGGSKVAARDILLETLALTRHGLYWRLLFDPSSKAYFLDIHSL